MSIHRNTAMRIVFISDTHTLVHRLVVPDGDVLVHCGDFTGNGSLQQVADFDSWLAKQPHEHKIVIAGNHDIAFEEAPESARLLLRTPLYLQDSVARIDGVTFYGSPWTPFFNNWAFNFPQDFRAGHLAAEETWAKIPDGVDVLVTHGPPYGILDDAPSGGSVGCDELLDAVERVKPRIHSYGHIHECYGTLVRGETLFVNACSCDGAYRPVNAPVVVDLVDGVATLVEVGTR